MPKSGQFGASQPHRHYRSNQRLRDDWSTLYRYLEGQWLRCANNMATIYPSLPGAADFGVIRIGGNGMGNCLYPYFHAAVMAKKYNCQMLAPLWWSIKIGPVLRGEFSLRRYGKMFRAHPDEIVGLRRALRLLMPGPRKRIYVRVGDQFYETEPSGLTVVKAVMGKFSFDGLHPHRAFIRQRLLEILITQPEQQPQWGNGAYAAAHIRLGDFAEPKTNLLQIDDVEGIRIPLDWYRKAILRVRALHPNLPIYVFSDGYEYELRSILDIPDVRIHREPNDVGDLLALAQARLLIGSNSTFSRWAAFLGNMSSIWLKTRRQSEKPTDADVPIFYVADDFETITALIKIDSPGPVFFRQPRIGLGNKQFLIWKFRTMHQHSCDIDGAQLTKRDDNRITPVGKILRKWSIDEVPQIFNVLSGDMSMVGPRPHTRLAGVGDQPYSSLVPDYHLRHCVKPGITGLAQVSGSNYDPRDSNGDLNPMFVRASLRKLRRTVIIGHHEPIHDLLMLIIERQKRQKCDIIGIVEYDSAIANSSRDFLGLPQFPDLDALERMIREDSVDSVVVALPSSSGEQIRTIIQRISMTPVDIYVYPGLDGLEFTWCQNDLPLLAVSTRPIAGWRSVIKRAEDLLLSLSGLALIFPIILFIALIVKLTSTGPIFFRQRRLGYNNRVIVIYKFRSMYTHLGDADASQQTSRDDNRITPFGAWLRKTSIDELPQIFNVIKGEMSLVGPRPHAMGTTAGGLTLEEAVPVYSSRHRVKPGITGWAQVNGYRGAIDSVEKIIQRVNHDLYYIENWSLTLDLQILWRTVKLVFVDENAY
ncbi:unnamed protein product [Sphagnum tenellum]